MNLADIRKAEKALCDGLPTALHMQNATDEPNSVCIVALEDSLHRRCALYCLLMPLRADDGHVFDMAPPAWALPAASAPAASAASELGVPTETEVRHD